MGLNLTVTGNTAEPEGGREWRPAEVTWEYIEQVLMLQMKSEVLSSRFCLDREDRGKI